MLNKWRVLFAVTVCAGLMHSGALWADQVNVRYAEGRQHGFLALQTLEGETIATGDTIQTATGDRVTSKVTLHFTDGSIQEEATEFSQRGKFQLLKYHLTQKGPTFKQSMETSMDVSTGKIIVQYTDDDGREKTLADRLKLPPDVANGMVPTLLLNIQPTVAKTNVSMVVTTPKPRIVKLTILPEGETSFSFGGAKRKATQYLIKVELGGAAGLVAPLVGKQPPDTHFWILNGQAPVFLRSEGPLFEGGPVWRISQIAAVWPGE